MTEIPGEDIWANEQEDEISLLEIGLHCLFPITASRDLKPLHVSLAIAQLGLQLAVK